MSSALHALANRPTASTLARMQSVVERRKERQQLLQRKRDAAMSSDAALSPRQALHNSHQIQNEEYVVGNMLHVMERMKQQQQLSTRGAENSGARVEGAPTPLFEANTDSGLQESGQPPVVPTPSTSVMDAPTSVPAESAQGPITVTLSAHQDRGRQQDDEPRFYDIATPSPIRNVRSETPTFLPSPSFFLPSDESALSTIRIAAGREDSGTVPLERRNNTAAVDVMMEAHVNDMTAFSAPPPRQAPSPQEARKMSQERHPRRHYNVELLHLSSVDPTPSTLQTKGTSSAVQEVATTSINHPAQSLQGEVATPPPPITALHIQKHVEPLAGLELHSQTADNAPQYIISMASMWARSGSNSRSAPGIPHVAAPPLPSEVIIPNNSRIVADDAVPLPSPSAGDGSSTSFFGCDASSMIVDRTNNENVDGFEVHSPDVKAPFAEVGRCDAPPALVAVQARPPLEGDPTTTSSRRHAPPAVTETTKQHLLDTLLLLDAAMRRNRSTLHRLVAVTATERAEINAVAISEQSSRDGGSRRLTSPWRTDDMRAMAFFSEKSRSPRRSDDMQRDVKAKERSEYEHQRVNDDEDDDEEPHLFVHDAEDLRRKGRCEEISTSRATISHHPPRNTSPSVVATSSIVVASKETSPGGGAVIAPPPRTRFVSENLEFPSYPYQLRRSTSPRTDDHNGTSETYPFDRAPSF